MPERKYYPLSKAISKFESQFGKPSENQNYLFSPISIHAFFTLLSQDPSFCNNDFLKAILCLNVNKATAQYKDIFTSLELVKDLLIANSLFVNQKARVQDVLMKRFRDNFIGDINFSNINDHETANKLINSWINSKTCQKIPQFNELNAVDNLTFLSALHFKNRWLVPFNMEKTVPGMFHLDHENTFDVQMMRRKDEYYYKNDTQTETKVLKLPVGDGGINFVIILPNKHKSSSEWEQIFNSYYLEQLTTNMIKQEVDVSIPKFKMSTLLDIRHCKMKYANLGDIFSTHFVGIVEDIELKLDKIQQNIFIDVNEQGLESTTGMASTFIETFDENNSPENGLIICQANILTDVTNHFAKTKVTWNVKNSNSEVQKATFKVILTKAAFVTDFFIEMNGKNYKSYLKETCVEVDTLKMYEPLFNRQNTKLTESKTRHSNEFTVSVNVEPNSIAIFCLTYEEMLQRLHERYELVLNICPGQIVENLNIEVHVNENRPLKFLKTPPLMSGNVKNMTENKYLDPQSDINFLDLNTALIKFHPDSARQKKMARHLGNKICNGLSGQFVVQYDIGTEPLGGEVLYHDGYFVHFFAPNNLNPFPKHVIFVLDTSGSMYNKMEYLKDGMEPVLGAMQSGDLLTLIEFKSEVKVWDIESKNSTAIFDTKIEDFKNPFIFLQECQLPEPQYINDNSIENAKEIIQNMTGNKGSFMIGGLETALYLAKVGQQRNEPSGKPLQPVIILVTDGEPNVGVGSKQEIVDLITDLNREQKAPIFSLSFGRQSDKNFLRKLSITNFGYYHEIYEEDDLAFQMQEFYKQISSVMSREIKFKYDEQVEEVSRSLFPTYFGGSEFVVAGRYCEPTFTATVECQTLNGAAKITPTRQKSVSSLERLWAYLTVKHLLDERDRALDATEITKRIIDLGLRYSFVTNVTDLVVVKPYETVTTFHTRSLNVAPGLIPSYAPLIRKENTFHTHLDSQATDLRYKRKMVFQKYSRDSIEYYSNDPVPVKAPRLCTASNRHSEALSHNTTTTLDNELEDTGVKTNINPLEEFTADHPFIIILQLERGDTTLLLFKGEVFQPNY